MKKPFRLKRRKNGVYYVLYAHDPDHPKSTGQTDRDEAIIWAEAHRMDADARKPEVLLQDFAEGFFDESSPYLKRLAARNHGRPAIAEAKLSSYRGDLKNYIIPKFGDRNISTIKAAEIDYWLLELTSVKNGGELSAESKNRVLTALRHLLGEAEYKELIEYNPAEKVKMFTGQKREREIFLPEELGKLFPSDHDALLKVWLTQEWATFFLLLATTGLRPGEVRALTWGKWLKEKRALLIDKALETGTSREKGIKTANTAGGAKVKISLLVPRVEQELMMLKAESKNTGPHERIFPSSVRWTETAWKHFNASCQRAEIDRRGRTQYCLRHTFNTLAMQQLTIKEVQDLMGHVTDAMTKRYHHPTTDMLIEKIDGSREHLERITASWTEKQGTDW